MADSDIVFSYKNDRLIYLHDDVSKMTMASVISDILEMIMDDDKKEEKEKNFVRKPIKLYINSSGGTIWDAWALIDVMTISKTPIHTYCTGYADSAAFMIFIAGKERFITKHTRMICHQFSSNERGMYQDIVESMKEKDLLWKDMEDYICSRTNIPRSKMEEIREKKLNYTIHSDESIGLGVATKILESI